MAAAFLTVDFAGDLADVRADPRFEAELVRRSPFAARTLFTVSFAPVRRAAGFTGAAGGLAFSSDVPADTSGYDFGTKFFFAPAAGTRVFFSSRLHLRAEFRANFWRLNYPLSFRQEPDPVIITGRDSEWDLSPWVLFGFGYTL